MVEQVIDNLKDLLPPELVVFVVSLLPILELRGGLVAASILGIDWIVAFPICVIGNMLPMPFILLFLKQIFAFLKRKGGFFGKMVCWLEERADRKSSSLNKYKLFGLFLFVAIPLPGTGAWTGALVAALMEMRMKRALPTIFLGVLIAGIAVTLVVSLGIEALSWMAG